MVNFELFFLKNVIIGVVYICFFIVMLDWFFVWFKLIIVLFLYLVGK